MADLTVSDLATDLLGATVYVKRGYEYPGGPSGRFDVRGTVRALRWPLHGDLAILLEAEDGAIRLLFPAEWNVITPPARRDAVRDLVRDFHAAGCQTAVVATIKWLDAGDAEQIRRAQAIRQAHIAAGIDPPEER